MYATRTLRPHRPLDLRATLAPLAVGRHDPTLRLTATALLRAAHTPDGPATLRASLHGAELHAEAWGPGASWALDGLPALVGEHDDLAGFDPAPHPLVARAHHRLPGLRIPRSGLVSDLLVPTVLAQKVSGAEAKRTWHRLVRRLGGPAPGRHGAGPEGLRLPPAPERLAATPYEHWHPLGLERRRAEVVRDACARLGRLEEAAAMPRAEAHRRLTALPGLGPWTAATIQRTAFGDADAVETGDYNLPHRIAWNLADEPRADDGRMLELLEAFRGHRGRVVRLLTVGGHGAPRYGARRPLHDVARL